MTFWTGLAGDEIDANMAPGVDVEACLDAIFPALAPALLVTTVPLATILDLGCGAGRLAIPMAVRLRHQARIVGVDPSPNLLWEARERDQSQLVEWLLSDGLTIPCRPESVDAAYSMLVFQHLPAEVVEGYFAELARVLVPGGRFRFQWTCTDAPDAPDAYQHDRVYITAWANRAGLYRVGSFDYDEAMGWWWATVAKQA